jgi:tetratricopeptide (TPR) repeat protein
MTSITIKIHPLKSIFARVLTPCVALALLADCTPAARGARVLERADRYFKAGEYDKARIEYLNVLRLDRTNRTAIRQLGIIWFDEGAPVRALPFLKATHDLDPANFDAAVKYASVLLTLGETEQAKKQALEILRQSPGNSEALLVLTDCVHSKQEIEEAEQQLRQFRVPESAALHLALASMALRKTDLATAENELKQAIALEPKSAIAHMSMANFRVLQKDLGQAGQEFKIAAELAPIRSNEHLKLAEFQGATGALNEARANLKEITRQAPDYLPGWLLFAQLALAEKKYDESLSLLENIFSRDPENIGARLLQAKVQLTKGENKKAVETLEVLNKTFPNIPGIEYSLARAYVQNNNPAQATAELKKAVAAQPGYVEAILLLAELNLRMGNPQPVISPMVDLLKKRPDLAAAGSLLAEAYRSQGQLDEAAAVLREQIKIGSQNPQAYFLLGVVLRQQNKTGEARQAFEKTLELAPDNLLPIDQLVTLDIVDNHLESAMRRVQTQLEKTPNSAGLHFEAAKIYIAQRAWDRAEAELSKALDLEPNYATAYELLISTYMATNRFPQAISELQVYLSKKPDDTRALMTLGTIYEKQKDTVKARDAYEKVLATNSEFVPALNNLAYLYADKLNELDKAYELARKARDLQPEEASIADTFGWVLFKKGDYQQALSLFQESSGKLGQSPDVQFHLGMASYMMGQAEKARAAFQQALKGGADFAGKEEAQRRLALLGDATSVELSNEQLESMLKQQPEDPLARLRLGESYEKEKAFAKASAEYEHALKVNPKLLSALIKVAQLNAGPLQNNEKALEFAKKARELAPTDAKVAGVLGNIAYHAGNFTWAYSLLQESARHSSDDPTVLHDYAWAAYSLGKVDEARELMQRALQTAPASPISEDAKSFLSMVALDQNQKDPTAVEPEVQQLLKADPQYVPALMARATIERRRGESKKAIGSYSEILQRFPDFAPAQKQLASLYLEDPNALDKAYDFAMKARKTLPGDPGLARTLGEISYQRKEYPRALQLLQESARTSPLDAKGLYYLGMSHWQNQQKPQGREALQRALAAGLQEPLASEAKRLLAEPKAN